MEAFILLLVIVFLIGGGVAANLYFYRNHAMSSEADEIDRQLFAHY